MSVGVSCVVVDTECEDEGTIADSGSDQVCKGDALAIAIFQAFPKLADSMGLQLATAVVSEVASVLSRVDFHCVVAEHRVTLDMRHCSLSNASTHPCVCQAIAWLDKVRGFVENRPITTVRAALIGCPLMSR